MTVRLIAEADIPAYYSMSLKLDAETPFRLYEDGERARDIGLFTAETMGFLKNPMNNIFLAVIDENPVGYLQAIGRTARRVRHVVSINIGILQEFTGRGIGGALFAALEGWAGKNGVRRLDLSVMTNNVPAMKLYDRLGFVREGVKRGSMFVDGKYIDEYYMCKWLEG